MNQFVKEKVLPFSLTAFVILLDQITKAIIVRVQPEFRHRVEPIWDVFGNELVEIIHVRNPALAFSLGQGLPEPVRPILFIVFPIIVLGFLVWYFFKSKDFTLLQRWAAAGIIGGGIGNILDRIFRPDGVVDFISIRLPDFFEFLFGRNPRWPTFNVADSAVVVCCIILMVTLFIPQKKSIGADK